jgi:hypothetical protein
LPRYLLRLAGHTGHTTSADLDTYANLRDPAGARSWKNYATASTTLAAEARPRLCSLLSICSLLHAPFHGLT